MPRSPRPITSYRLTGLVAAALAVVLVVLAAGCTGHPAAPTTSAGPSAPVTPTPAPTGPPPRTALPAAATTVVAGTGPAELALGTSRALFTNAPAVVLAAVDDPAGITAAAPIATRLGVPLLLTPATGAAGASGTGGADLVAEVGRLGSRPYVTVGAGAAAWQSTRLPVPAPPVPSAVTVPSPAGNPTLTPLPTPAGPTAVAVPAGPVDPALLPDVTPAAPLTGLLVLALTGPDSTAAIATAQAAGARTVLLANADPRVDSASVKALAGQPTAHVLAVGTGFGPVDLLRGRVDTAATGVELPGGGQVVFPGRRMVALYGHPGGGALGVLGEQGVDASVARARSVAAGYNGLVAEPVIPAFEIIATVASAGAGSDGNYSNESPVSLLQPWVDAAQKAGIYVLLDLQSGRSDFLSQAKLYTDLLRRPGVGLALDPEWRLGPDQVPMHQIGTVDAAEINQTAQWLADLTATAHLPQKVLMVHQFRLDMITNRATVRTDYDQLRVVIHADGFGTPGAKNNTWNALHVNAPANVAWGWKNFYDEDKPTFTPAQTMAQKPTPVFVSYQ